MIRFLAKILIFRVMAVALLLTAVCDLQAQKRKKTAEYLEGKSLFFGAAHVGLSMSQVDGDNFSGYNKYNLNFSATAYTKIDRNLALSTEIGYNTKGSRGTGKQLPYLNNMGEEIESYEITLGYAEFAFLGNVFDRKRNNIGTGVSYGRLVSSDEEANNIEQTDIPFEKNALDWILNAQLKIHPEYELFLDFRFQYSILPIRKNYTGNYGRAEQLNKQILLRIGYLF